MEYKTKEQVFEAIKPTRGIVIEKRPLYDRWANSHPGSFLATIITGYFTILGGVIFWCSSL